MKRSVKKKDFLVRFTLVFRSLSSSRFDLKYFLSTMSLTRTVDLISNETSMIEIDRDRCFRRQWISERDFHSEISTKIQRFELFRFLSRFTFELGETGRVLRIIRSRRFLRSIRSSSSFFAFSCLSR